MRLHGPVSVYVCYLLLSARERERDGVGAVCLVKRQGFSFYTISVSARRYVFGAEEDAGGRAGGGFCDPKAEIHLCTPPIHLRVNFIGPLCV